MTHIVLEHDAYYKLILKTGDEVLRARYDARARMFFTNGHGYTFDSIKEIVRRMPS